MRKFLLIAVLAAVVQVSSAQAPTNTAKPVLLRNPRISNKSNEDRPIVALPQGNTPSTHALPNNHNRTNRTEKNYHALNTTKIGSAGNLLTVSNVGCNQVHVNNALNLVSFVHRGDDLIDASQIVSKYSYDVSKDGGTTWTNNIGPITNDPDILNDGTGPHGRFPQALIYNPLNNLLADSAYLIYSGTWHDATSTGTSGTWVGQLVGRGQFTGNNSTFNYHLDTINNGTTDIATGLCEGAPGVFWAVNVDFTGTFSTSSNDITNGIIVEKGVWNPITRDVDWTANEIHQKFDSFISGSVNASAAQSFNIAFDPTGQIGWISCIGDLTDRTLFPGNDSVFYPIFWKTTDGGTTWSNAIAVPLDSLPGVVEALDSVTIYPVAGGATGAFTSQVPTTAFESALTVDYAGNPHFFTTVGNGNSYSIESGAGYRMYDITLNPADTGCRPTNNGWAAIFVDSVATLRGNTTTDGTPLTEDNHPIATRTPDGKRVYFLWEASDPKYAQPGSDPQGDDNTFRNLFARGFDVVHSTSTKAINLTENDANWGAPDSANNGATGVYGAANYPEVSPIVQIQGTSDFIPLVLTQISYNTNSGLSTDPAQFYYINNVSFSQFDFVNGLSASLTPIGNDTVVVVVGGSYSDAGATINYLDTACTHSGLLHVVTNGSSVNTNTPGTYYVYYAAEDANGNIYASGQRVVEVVSAPVADFTFSGSGLSIDFTDHSLYNPDTYAWTFGDGGSDAIQNPVHTYAADGAYNVCLISSNAYGSSAQVCKSVVVPVGIKNVDFSSTVNVFPNPTNGNVSITLTGNSIPDFTVSVYNVLGAQVIAASEYKSGTTNLQLNAGSLADGIYMIKIQSNQGSAVKRLTVAHK